MVTGLLVSGLLFFLFANDANKIEFRLVLPHMNASIMEFRLPWCT